MLEWEVWESKEDEARGRERRATAEEVRRRSRTPTVSHRTPLTKSYTSRDAFICDRNVWTSAAQAVTILPSFSYAIALSVGGLHIARFLRFEIPFEDLSYFILLGA